MKKKKINLTPAVLFLAAGAVLMFAVHAYAACGDNYHACRCKQYTGGNFSSLGVSSLNDCCNYRQQGCDVGTSYFSGTGLTFDSASGKCKTPCSTCPSGQTRTSVSFSDDGACCQTAITCPSGKVNVNGVCKTPCPSACPTGYKLNGVQYYEDGTAPKGDGDACCGCVSGSLTTGGMCCADPANAQQPPGGRCSACGGSCCASGLYCALR